jgi:hypothetical protein
LSLCGYLGDDFNQLGGDESFAVVLNDHGVEMGSEGAQSLLHFGKFQGGEFEELLAIHPHDLLLPSGDARFGDGGHLVANQERAGVHLVDQQELA